MCRSIKTLRSGAIAATPEEIEAAALQFVRKISGYRKPAPKNADAFNAAVAEITLTSERLLSAIVLYPTYKRGQGDLYIPVAIATGSPPSMGMRHTPPPGM